MLLEEQIKADYITAMKGKDSATSSCLSFLRAQLKNVYIDKRVDKLEDPDVIAVIKKQVKQRQDSIEQFRNGGREDLAQKEEAEMVILKKYLPAEMSAEQLKNVVMESIKESGAASVKDMGNVMKIVMAKTAGRADGKIVSDLVKQHLANL